MGKFDGILLASDFDGTLFWQKTVSAENAEAIRYFQEEGGLFTLASGREAPFIRKFSSYFRPNAPVISVNGSVIYDLETDRLLGCRAFEYGEAWDVVRRIFSAFDDMTMGSVFRLMGCSMIYNRPDLEEQLRRMDPVMTKLVFSVRPEISAERTQQIRRLLGSGYEVCRSCTRIIEVMTAASGKGNGVRMVADILDGRVRKIVCAGDYENDLTMIRAADVGYAVGNAVPVLKAAADRVTVHCRRNAIAAIIRDLEADAAAGR